MMPICRHVKLKLTTSVSRRIRRVKNSSVVYTQFVTPHENKPATTVGPLNCSTLLGAGQLRTLAYNLMYALTAELKLISNLAKRLSAESKIHYQRVALRVRGWAWLEWSPLPSGNCLKLLDPGLRKKTLLVALPHVANPGTKIDFLGIKNFNVRGRNAAVSLPDSELIKCIFISVESGDVVHNAYNSGVDNSEV